MARPAPRCRPPGATCAGVLGAPALWLGDSRVLTAPPSSRPPDVSCRCRSRRPQNTHIYAPCSRFWTPEVQNQGVPRAVLQLEAPGEGPSHPPQPLGAAGRPWPEATHFSPCLSVCLSVCLPLCVCRNDTSFGAQRDNPGGSHLEIRSFAPSTKTLLPNTAPFGGVSRICWEAAFLHLSQAPSKAVTIVSSPFTWRTEP